MAFYKDMKNQQWLLPPNLEDIISKDHICYLVDEVIDSIDFRDVEVEYEGPGHPAYHPRIYTKLLIMGMVDGIRSSRKIDKNAKENVIYMFLAGKLTPDFRSISDFRKNNCELIEYCFKEVVRFAKKLGMVRLGHISIDGSKIKACASRDKTLTKDELLLIEKIIKDEILNGINEDTIEDEIYGKDKDGYELPEDIKLTEHIKKLIHKRIEEEKIEMPNKKFIRQIANDYVKGDEEKRRKIVENIDKAKAEIEKSDMGAISLTDPESRFMKNKKNCAEHSYNPQITVDSEQDIIIANDVVQDRNDENQLIPQIEKSEENIGSKLPEGTEVSADNGYYNGTNLGYLNNRRFDGYIPDQHITQTMKGKHKEKNPFGKESFEYDHENDEFICPASEGITFRYGYFDKYKGKNVRVYKGTSCRRCVYYKQCVKNREGVKVIVSYGFEKERGDMAKKFETDDGKEKYKTRAMIAEHPFGDIKQNMGFREFLTRGVNNVKTEFNLACIAYNLKRIWNFLTEKSLNIHMLSATC